MSVELRTAGPPVEIVPQVRAVIASLDRDLPMMDVRTQLQQVAATNAGPRLFAQLTAAFGLLALVLAGIGIYGIMAYRVARRTGEIGIRMALGAQRERVLSMVLREALWMTAAGLAAGLLAALWLAHFVASMLYGVARTDPVILTGVAVTLGTMALLAAWAPAWRAARIEPMQALRHD